MDDESGEFTERVELVCVGRSVVAKCLIGGEAMEKGLGVVTLHFSPGPPWESHKTDDKLLGIIGASTLENTLRRQLVLNLLIAVRINQNLWT